MITIIISSFKPNLFEKLKTNISDTIGVVYEIIKIDNPGVFGLCEAYNKGVQKASFRYLCFAHEDILFKTLNWGERIIEHFQSDKSIGLIGVAGSAYKTWILSGWGYARHTPTRFFSMNIVQVNSKDKELNLTSKFNNTLSQVASIDGCLMFSTKSTFNFIKFDEELFTKYHCYDVDFSLQVNMKFKVMVAHDILITHFSEGTFDKKWCNETIKLHKKWKKYLPIVIGTATKDEILDEESGAFYSLLSNVLLHGGFELTVALNYFNLKFLRKIGLSNWLRVGNHSLKMIKLSIQEKLNIK